MLYGVVRAPRVLAVAPASHRVQHRYRCFDSRQAKRLVPLVGAAGTSVALRSARARLLVHPFGTGSLLIAGGVLCAAALPLVSLLAKLPRPRWWRPGGRSSHGCAMARARRCAPRRPRNSGGASLFAARAARWFRSGPRRLRLQSGAQGALPARADGGVSRIVQRCDQRADLGGAALRHAPSDGAFRSSGSAQALPASLVAVGAFVAFAPSLASAAGAKLVESATRLSLGGAVSDLFCCPPRRACELGPRPLLGGGRSLATVIAFGALLPVGRFGVSAWAIGVLLACAGVLAWPSRERVSVRRCLAVRSAIDIF